MSEKNEWIIIPSRGEILISFSQKDPDDPDPLDYYVMEHLVIAWRMPRDGSTAPCPITNDGMYDPVYSPEWRVFAINTGDGRVRAYGDLSEAYDSVEAFGRNNLALIKSQHERFWTDFRKKREDEERRGITRSWRKDA